MKLLVIRFSSIGDIVLTTPVLRCIAHQVKGAEIHYLTKSRFEPIVGSNPYITKVHVYNSNLSEVIGNLRKENFDHIIDLHNNLRSFLVKAALIKPSHSFNKLNLKKWLTVKFKWNVLPDKHIVDRYLATVKFLNIANDHKGLDFFIPAEVTVPFTGLLAPLCSGYVACVIGGNHNTKILPADKVAEICNRLNSAGKSGAPVPIVLLGGSEDAERGNAVVNSTGSNVLNLCGKFSLMQSAHLVKHAKAVITNDTGLMHIAAAFNKPIVSVWGNTIPEFGMYPYLTQNTPHHLAQVNGLACRPCSKIGYSECPLGHFNCMKQQNTEAISSFILSVLKNDQSLS